jgi:hypothetical protein
MSLKRKSDEEAKKMQRKGLTERVTLYSQKRSCKFSGAAYHPSPNHLFSDDLRRKYNSELSFDDKFIDH